MASRAARPAEPETRYFENAAAFRRWLDRHHAGADVLWVGFHKVGTGKPSLTWPESVDEALCFGWIDGVRQSVDGERYRIRFTPRRPGSTWSAVNVRRYEALTAAGRVASAGEAAYARRRDDRTGVYAFEQRAAPALAPEEDRAFRADAAAWAGFQAQPPGYRRTALHWVVSAKRPDTRARRLATLRADSAAGRRIAPLRRPDRPAK